MLNILGNCTFFLFVTFTLWSLRGLIALPIHHTVPHTQSAGFNNNDNNPAGASGGRLLGWSYGDSGNNLWVYLVSVKDTALSE